MSSIEVPTVGDWSSLGLLFALLPGLLTYVVHHALVYRNQRIEATHAVLWALAYTLLVHAFWELLKLPGSFIPTPDVIGLPLIAGAMGLLLSYCSTQGWIYSQLRALGFTRESSWETLWLSAFHECRYKMNIGYAVLHLKDGRRVYGGIAGFGSKQQNGHVALNPFQWLGEDAKDQLPMSENLLLIEADLIAFVEFRKPEVPQEEK